MRFSELMLALALGACATAGVQAPAPKEAEVPAAGGEAGTTAVLEVAADEALRSTTTPGLAVIEIREGLIMPEVVRGVRAIDSGEPVQRGDSWHIGSNAKPFTTTLAAILVERGRLSWDSRLADLLPDLADVLHPAYRDVTVAELASHRSGFPAEAGLALITPFYDDTRPLAEQRTTYLRQVLGHPPAQPRGTYTYSNRGFVVLGAVLERAGGAPVEELLRDLIFRPLGMTTASFGPTTRGQPIGHEGGRPLLGSRQDNPAFLTTAGTIRMSMPDWARWALDQIEGEYGRGRLLTAASYRLLHTPQVAIPGRTTSVAMDWGVREENFGRILTHTGSNGAWYAVIALAPDIRSGILIATNSAEDMKGDEATDPPFRAMTDLWREQAARTAQ